MRRIASCAVALGAVASVLASQTPSDEVELLRLETVWNEAHRHGDADALDRLWAADLRVIVPGMPPIDKAGALAVVRTGRIVFERYETSEVILKIYGDAGVVTGRLRRSRRTDGELVEDDWRFTKVSVRQPDGWRVVAFHASPAG